MTKFTNLFDALEELRKLSIIFVEKLSCREALLEFDKIRKLGLRNS